MSTTIHSNSQNRTAPREHDAAHITRRAAIRTMASISATGAAGAAFAAAQRAEPESTTRAPAAPLEGVAREAPLNRIKRLTTELAEALEEWGADCGNPWHIVVPRASAAHGWYILNGAPSYRRDGKVT